MELCKDSVLKAIDIFFENEVKLATATSELSGKETPYRDGFLDALKGSKERLKLFVTETLQEKEIVTDGRE